MALSPNQIIKVICPALAGSPSLPVFVEMAAGITDAGFFGSSYSYAVAYRACHLFTISGVDGGGGGSSVLGMGKIASMSEGGMSVTFAQDGAASRSDGLDTTKYGKLLEALIKSRPTMGVNTVGLK